MSEPGAQPPSQHPAPKRGEVQLHESFFALFGGPLAWFVQINAGFALASQPCFAAGERLPLPPPAAAWTYAAIVAVVVGACLVSLLAALISWRAYMQTQDEKRGSHGQVLEVGSGRTRFSCDVGCVVGIWVLRGHRIHGDCIRGVAPMRRLMLLLVLLLCAAACDHGKRVRGDGHVDETQAKALIADRCGSCHRVPSVAGANGRVGPSLDGISHQQIIAGHFANTPELLTAWIEHPQRMLPGDAMPELGLSHEQARLLVNYLYSVE